MIFRYRLGLLAALLFYQSVSLVAAQSTPYVLSERVGLEIDAEEQSYFGLFPEIEGYRIGRAYQVGDSIQVVIEAGEVDSALTVSRPVAEALGRFIETFERHETAFRNPSWQTIRSYARADVPVPYAGVRKAATFFIEGGQHKGQVAYASDSLVLLVPRSARFDWRTFEGEGLVLKADEIQRVRLVPDWIGRPYVVLAGIPAGIAANEWLSSFDDQSDVGLEERLFAAAIGAAVFKAVSVFYARPHDYRRARSDVEAAGWFTRERQPLEMPPESEIVEQMDREQAEPEPRWQGRFGWLSLGTGGLSLRENSGAYRFISGFDPEADPERRVRYEQASAVLEAAAALRPAAWFNVGAGVYVASSEGPSLPSDPIPFADIEEVAFSRPLVRVFADLDVIRVFNDRSRFGLAVGGGMLRSESKVSMRVSPVEGRAGMVFTYSPTGYDIEEAGFRPFFQATLSAGLALETSLYLTLVAHSAPDVEVPLFEARPDFNPVAVVFSTEPHTVSFKYLSLSAGVRLGF